MKFIPAVSEASIEKFLCSQSDALRVFRHRQQTTLSLNWI